MPMHPVLAEAIAKVRAESMDEERQRARNLFFEVFKIDAREAEDYAEYDCDFFAYGELWSCGYNEGQFLTVWRNRRFRTNWVPIYSYRYYEKLFNKEA